MSKITKKMVKEFISDYYEKDYEYIMSSCIYGMKEYDSDLDLMEENDFDSIEKLKNYMTQHNGGFQTIDEDYLEDWNDIDEVFEYLNSGLEINHKSIKYLEKKL